MTHPFPRESAPVPAPPGNVSILGVVLAGGESRRFGSLKAVAEVAGVPMVVRAVEALASTGLPVAVVTSREDVRDAVRQASGGPGTVFLEDRVPGAGPLGGLHAALCRAREQEHRGVLLLGCDLPLLPSGLVRIVAEEFEADPSRPVAPESPGPRGIEPLVGCYPVAILPEVERRLRGPDGRALADLLAATGARRIPLRRIREVADPKSAFLNVNTPADRKRAETRAAKC